MELIKRGKTRNLLDSKQQRNKALTSRVDSILKATQESQTTPSANAPEITLVSTKTYPRAIPPMPQIPTRVF
jgi:hypothetical protein